MADVLDDDWEKWTLEEKLEAMGFEAKGPDRFLESAMGALQVKRLHEILDAYAGAQSIVEAVDEETQGSDCESCKRIQAMLTEGE